MWTCEKCNASVDDKFENCPICGTGRDGSEAPVDFVKKKDAIQPGLPAANQIDPQRKNKLVAIILVVAIIVVLLVIGLAR